MSPQVYLKDGDDMHMILVKLIKPYLRNFIMRAVTCRADLVIWSFRYLSFNLKAPDRLHPWIFFSIHKADGYIVLPTSTK